MVTMHGETKTAIYRVWLQMRARCNTPTTTHFNRYGGRGIVVCERWNEFLVFKTDMGPRPAGFTIERLDNDGPYAPTNCKWVSRKDQANNRNCNVRITFRGETLTVMQWSERTGLHYNTIMGRRDLGWEANKIFSDIKQINYSGLQLGGAANAKRQQARTHCKRGHEFTQENTGEQTSAKGTPSRFCRLCKAIVRRRPPVSLAID